MSESLLTCSGLSCSIGERRLFQNLSFVAKEGQFIAIIGHSGVGKSSLLRILSGQDPSPTSTMERKGRMAEVPQMLSLCPGLDAQQTIATGCLSQSRWWQTLWGLSRESLEQARGLAGKLGLEDSLSKPVELLSGGERQRVAIARALIQQPNIIVADEPVSMLDEKSASSALALLREEVKRHRRAVVCVLHHGSHINEYADAVLELSPSFPNGWEFRPGGAL